MCREHGLQITELAAEYEIPYFGIVKETVDPLGLGEFHEKYFGKGVLYRDVELQYYKALGNKNVNLIPMWNPFKLYRWFQGIGKRMNDKNIEGNLKGEGLKQGGILIFDKGELKYAQEEVFGEPLDMDALRKAVEEVFSASESLAQAKEEL